MLVAALSLTGCTALIRASHTPNQPPAAEAWAQARAVAASQVGAGSYAAADRALADFAARYPRTPEALSATLRRAVYMADPANGEATARGATALLDSALAQPLDSAGRSDARALRRITMALQRVATLSAEGGANASSPDSSARSADEKANSDEIQRLRTELAKANAELERIKKRVSQPKP